jgi:SulP family sulfate permease
MLLQLPRLGRTLRGDAFAGFTVAMVVIPQSLAYAAIAGVAPIHGLYCAVFPAVVGALFGSSSYLVTGPTNATALVTLNVLQSQTGLGDYLQLVFALAVLSGLIKLALGLLRLGWIIRYISNSVLTGFLAGAAILIALSQLTSALGLPSAPQADAVSVVTHTARLIGRLNAHVLATTALTVVLLLAFKWANRKLPSELLAVGIVGIAVRLLGWSGQGVRLVSDMGALQAVTLIPHVPAASVDAWRALLPSAGAVALFSLVEAMSIAKAISLRSGEALDPSREFVGQGLASLAGGLFQAIPSSGSPSRTAILYSSGGSTRLAATISGIVVLLTLIVFGWLLGYVPVAGLAGVIIVSAYSLINWHQLRLAWQSGARSRLVLGVTFAATLLLPLHFAIYLGAILSLVIYVYESSKLQISYITQNASGGFVEHSLDDILHAPPSITIVNIEGTLSFGAAEDLEQRVDEIIRAGVMVVILRLRRMRLLGSEGVAALERIAGYASRSGTRVLVCGVKEDVQATLDSSGLKAVLGAEQIFKASDVLFASTQQAIARAQEIVLEQTRRVHGD